MKPASKRKKGKRLELFVAREMARYLDKRARRMPMSGLIEWMKGDVYNTLNLYIECKNQETVKLYEWFQKIRDKQNPRLIISGNYRPVVVVLPFNDWLALEEIKKDHENKTS